MKDFSKKVKKLDEAFEAMFMQTEIFLNEKEEVKQQPHHISY